jgi:hypothetical protein
MTTSRFFLAGIACVVVINPLCAQGQIDRAEALPSILKRAETDSVQYIERTSAYLFHQKINSYRAEKNVGALQWDDTLWLAARNHNMWMMENNKLSHDENSGTALYTGASPGGRYAYVTSNKGKTQWSGENVLYNYSAYGKNAKEIANNIAQHSFDQWQASPGHNENMLNESSYLHGVAFKLEGGKVWSTDLFARKPYDPRYATNTFKAPLSSKFTSVSTAPSESSEPTAATETVVSSGKKLSNFQYEKSIREKLSSNMFGEDIVIDKNLAKAAKSHLSYMVSNKTSTSEEKKGKNKYTGRTPEKRVKKASHLSGLFKRMRTTVSEYVFTKQYAEADFDADVVVRDATSKFAAEQRKQKGDLKSTGMAVQVRKVKTTYTVYIVALERRKKVKEKKEKEEEGPEATF